MDNKLIKKDRLRYTKNKASANLSYLAILFNVLYFVSIYSSDSGKYYYTAMIGASVVYNLLFLLFTFLSSEGLKNYKLGYAIAVLGIGVMQIVRIFGIPLLGFLEILADGSRLISPLSFVALALLLGVSSVCCIVAIAELTSFDADST